MDIEKMVTSKCDWTQLRNLKKARLLLIIPCNAAACASLKKVLPVITNSKYDDMEINEGTMASIEYSRVTFGKNIDEKDRQRVYKALEKYCDLDTKGMIEILESLYNIASK